MNPGAETLVRTMRAHGGHAALVSGGFTLFTGPITERVGFDEHHSNVLVVEDGSSPDGPLRSRSAAGTPSSRLCFRCATGSV